MGTKAIWNNMKVQFTFPQDRTGKILFSVKWVKKKGRKSCDATLFLHQDKA